MASCARCHGATDAPPHRWCKDCEVLYDKWVRRHEMDIVWQALVGSVIISGVGLGLPILGVSTLVAAIGAVAGFGAMLGLSRLTRRRRRHQFLQAPLPRAYLPAPK